MLGDAPVSHFADWLSFFVLELEIELDRPLAVRTARSANQGHFAVPALGGDAVRFAAEFTNAVLVHRESKEPRIAELNRFGRFRVQGQRILPITDELLNESELTI
jgi:hypothetical protein